MAVSERINHKGHEEHKEEPRASNSTSPSSRHSRVGRNSTKRKAALHHKFYNHRAYVAFVTALPEFLDSRFRGNGVGVER